MNYELVGTALVEISVGITNPPSVAITSPGPASRISGDVVLTASANDDTGVAGVQFRLNGKPLGGEVLKAPYKLTWNTRQVASGTHTLTAIARDRDGNTTESTPMPVFVFNTIGRPGVIASYAFNEGSGAIVHDGTGNGHHGTIAGATWAANQGRFGHALAFTGTGMVSIASSIGLELNGPLTIEAWVRPDANTGQLTVVAKEHAGEMAYALYANRVRGPTGLIRVSCAEIAAVGPAPLTIGQWTHLAMTYDGAFVRLYNNGAEIRRVAISGPLDVSGGTLRIGGSTLLGQYFKGLIDEVRIYNRALSAAEIQQDMTTAI
jgi:hypothetical protein